MTVQTLMREESARRPGKRNNVSSLLQDVRKGRRTEVDYLNGAIVKLGEEVGVDASANRLLVDAVHRIEHGALEPGPAAVAELLQLARVR